VRVASALQRAGDFIVTFPRGYHRYLSLSLILFSLCHSSHFSSASPFALNSVCPHLSLPLPLCSPSTNLSLAAVSTSVRTPPRP
jgi:hypothetical protein